jgi:hypothetical protein
VRVGKANEAMGEGGNSARSREEGKLYTCKWRGNTICRMWTGRNRECKEKNIISTDSVIYHPKSPSNFIKGGRFHEKLSYY